MLTCYGHRIRLPQNDLAYMAFRLALQETLSDIQLHLDLDEEPDVRHHQPSESWAWRIGKLNRQAGVLR